MMKVKPCGYRVVIKPDPIEEVSKGGIVIATDYEGRKQRERAGQIFGTLVAIGPSAWKDEGENWAEVGDRVMYSKYSGKTLKDEDTEETVVIVNDTDIIAIVEKTVEDDRIDGEVTA